jgi:hypothetical protein
MDGLSAAGRVLIGAGLLAVAAGAVLEIAVGGTIAEIAGAGLLGLAAIAFVALAFLLVGESEDRDRKRNPRG